MGSSSRASNEVHRTKTVHALVLTDNIDMAATALLQITDSLAATTDDETNSAVRDHDLRGLFTFTKGRLLARCLLGSTSVATSLTSRVAAVFLNDTVDLTLCADTSTRRSCDAALALGPGLRAVDELDPSA
jgi:hypothetical protein